jgi:hypothetical protein
LTNFFSHITYQQGDFEDPATYTTLATRCEQMGKNWRGKAIHISRFWNWLPGLPQRG